MGDNALILGQRMSEWCGHSPFLEEDIAMANCALDHVGRARMLLSHAGTLEDKGRTEDDLAFLRDEREFFNFLICELPIGDYAFTLMRQYLLDVYHFYLYTRLQQSSDSDLAAIAAKAIKETTYHVRRTGDWIIKLGDGSEESHRRMQASLDEVWGYTGEFFVADEVDDYASTKGIGPHLDAIRSDWEHDVFDTLRSATLSIPDEVWPISGGRDGIHTEAMGGLLAEMQFLQRSYPGLNW
jgi:ring-1,2-phenylacetyl-CoA epoxidase subunit PaaC